MERFSGDLAGRGLEVVSDAICPWCYVGKRRLAKALTLLAQDGLTFAVRWLPFQLNPDMPKGGVDRRAYRTRKLGSWERSQALDARGAAGGARRRPGRRGGGGPPGGGPPPPPRRGGPPPPPPRPPGLGGGGGGGGRRGP